VYRRVLQEARPYWLHLIGGLFVSLLTYVLHGKFLLHLQQLFNRAGPERPC
jgi:hypothetical protein